MELINKLKEVLSTITEESQTAFIKKSEELGFDINRGEIPLSEAFYNLNQAKDILVDAIEKGKLNQVPISIQKDLLKDLDGVNAFFSGLLSGGTDEIVNVVNSIEQLYVVLWQYNIHNISDEHLGYLKKMNQMKYQITKAKELEKELEEGIKVKTRLTKIVEEFETKANEINGLLSNSTVNSSSITESLNKNTETNQKIFSIVTTIEQNEKTILNLVAESKTSDSEIKALEGRFKAFAGEIDGYKKTIGDISDTAKSTVEDNKEATKELIDELQILENQIKDQIEKATGHSLFHSFQTRQISIDNGKNKWLYGIAGLVIVTLGLTAVIAFSHNTYDVAFYLKLSMSIPLIFAISFCTIQYSRERKLEEEYAFKSNISISLIPYKELVEKMSTTPEEKAKYTAFLIDSINKVFTSPTEKIFGEDHGKGSDKSLKDLGKALESVLKPIEPVLKILQNK